jgi:hypothetical protein
MLEAFCADCEVDACNEHVGQGAGQPHLHGDPFHEIDGTCMYGPTRPARRTRRRGMCHAL